MDILPEHILKYIETQLNINHINDCIIILPNNMDMLDSSAFQIVHVDKSHLNLARQTTADNKVTTYNAPTPTSTHTSTPTLLTQQGSRQQRITSSPHNKHRDLTRVQQHQQQNTYPNTHSLQNNMTETALKSLITTYIDKLNSIITNVNQTENTRKITWTQRNFISNLSHQVKTPLN